MVFDAEAEQLVNAHAQYGQSAKTTEEHKRALQLSQDNIERALLKAYELGKRHGADR